MKTLSFLILILYTSIVSAEDLPQFSELAQVLGNTTPGRDNRDEWEAIRENISQNEGKDDSARFYSLVKTLNETKPVHENTAEWEEVRATCHLILANWNLNDDKLRLYATLLKQLSVITPLSANKKEWEKIRKVSRSILIAIQKDYPNITLLKNEFRSKAKVNSNGKAIVNPLALRGRWILYETFCPPNGLCGSRFEIERYPSKDACWNRLDALKGTRLHKVHVCEYQ